MAATEKLVVTLRPITIQDVTPSYVGWLRDPEVNQYLETRFTEQTLETVATFVKRMLASADEFLFAICVDSRHVGNIKVGPIKTHHGVADVSLFVGDRSVWGKGVATKAILDVSRHAFEVLKVRKLAAGAYAPNVGSARAFLRAGYRQEGVRREHYLMDGKPVDLLEFGLTANEFAKEHQR